MKKVYNKLVRDKILEIIKKDKAKPKIRILEQDEYINELFKKLEEEVEECNKVRGDKRELIKEIGDIHEVLEAIIKNYELDELEIQKLKQARREKRGGFTKRIYLESMTEE
jgi:predicted house-cleaning noncanonical NTP pyrophosphatase (MazG superfamily)